MDHNPYALPFIPMTYSFRDRKPIYPIRFTHAAHPFTPTPLAPISLFSGAFLIGIVTWYGALFLLNIKNKEKMAVHKDKETFPSSTLVEKPEEPRIKILKLL